MDSPNVQGVIHGHVQVMCKCRGDVCLALVVRLYKSDTWPCKVMHIHIQVVIHCYALVVYMYQ